jgi:hypothetical protein
MMFEYDFLMCQTEDLVELSILDKFPLCSLACVKFHSHDVGKVMQIIIHFVSKLPNFHYNATVNQDAFNYYIVLM